MKENQLAKALLLLLIYIPSQPLFWKIMMVIHGENKIFPIQQFFFACAFTVFSIALTEDIKLFNGFWEKNPTLRKYFDKMLHYSTVILLFIPRITMFIICIESKNKRQEYEQYKLKLQDKIDEYDKMPLIIRTLMPVTVLTMIWTCLVLFNLVSANVMGWVQEILGFLVSVVGFIFIIANLMEK